MSIRQHFIPVVNGQLTQVGTAFRSTREHVKSAVFLCTCGRRTITMIRLVRTGVTKTCGNCKPKARHDDTWNKKRSRVYIAWMNMRQRCLNENNKDYPNYGARGIAICKEWENFDVFHGDMGDPPPKLSLDRIENDKGYCKENCRWATKAQQIANRRSPRK